MTIGISLRRLLAMAWYSAWLVASAYAQSETPAPSGVPPPSQILDACTKYEVPRMLQLLGTSLIRSREDAALAAHQKCQFVVASCTAYPSSDDCQRSLRLFGLGDPSYKPSPGAALYDAAERGWVSAINRLLAEGAGPNWQNTAGWTPLMIAAAEKHLDAVVALLDGKADPNIRNSYGRTAIMYAASYGQDAIVEKLLAAGADPNLVPNDRSGWTALVAAAARGHAKTVEVLLRAGADPAIRAKDGISALELARSQGHAEVVRILEAFSARS